MDRQKCLIFKDGKDITDDVVSCSYNPQTHRYDVTFKNQKNYSCNYQSIMLLSNPKPLDPELLKISFNGRELYNIQSVFVYTSCTSSYWHICFHGGRQKTFDRNALNVRQTCLGESVTKHCLNYLKQLAAINELKSEDGKILLLNQYEKLKFLDSSSAMALYLDPVNYKIHVYNNRTPIFPFGGNASQFKAVTNALCNQMSVIQGPPGTGKTQTILNIIANLLIDNKSVQVVSNNNSATQNVLEKLSKNKYGLDFIVAALGNSENKKEFVRSQKGHYPDISHWALDADKQRELKYTIDNNVRELSEIFSSQEQLAMLRQQLSSLNLETKYFEQYCLKVGIVLPLIKLKSGLNAEKLLHLWQECEVFAEKERPVPFLFKFKCVFIFKITKWRFFHNSIINIITLFQKEFYEARRNELNNKIKSLENFLIASNAKGKMESLEKNSLKYLHAKVFERYGNKPQRITFNDDDLWKHPNYVLSEYPIVLSTTFSSVSCLKGVTYDYLIMDEASQVDIATGALSLSTARNAVIVGDLKQLPNIVNRDMKSKSSVLFDSTDLPHGYSFADNSFLKSVCSLVPNIPQTLLREHYRCHPKIIGFCNKKFYDNKLIIMKEDNGEPDVLTVIKTTIGNHKRGHINQRQIDVTLQEALPKLTNSDLSEIGIIAPYRDQVSELQKQLGTDKLEVDTVHKFQGREKDTIIVTTVDDVVSDFSDDPYLLNVAVSRAVNKLCLIVSGNKQPSDSNISDLISYIEYNNYHIIESNVNSVFDLLYKQYTEARIAYLRKYREISYYNSENLMYIALEKLLESRISLSLDIICHQPLNLLINNDELLDSKQKYYVYNTLSHVDFLIYNKISKAPVLAIEVDGFKYHMHGTHQFELDRMKDEILKLYNIPLLRLPTNGSGEIEKVNSALDGYEKNR